MNIARRSAGGSKSQRATIWEADQVRASRIVLLSGERGTGKTTVLLSIMKDCRDARVSGQKNSDDDPLLHRVATRTIWLEPIDMETLPSSANLLAAILTRIEHASRGFQKQKPQGLRQRRGLLDEEHLRDPFAPLKQLQTQVAIAWDGNLGARSGNLDLDAYAVELLRAERSRLSLNGNFSEALDELANVMGDDPMFVLFVDDFDLNPSRSLEILNFLRAISVPGMFAIVLGDQKVAELILDLRLAGAFAELVGGGATFSPLLPIFSEEIQTMSGELASRLVRKLIPPAQVIRLSSMTVPEALNCSPPTDGPEGSGRKLYELLWKCPVPLNFAPPGDKMLAGPKVSSLADFMFIQQLEPLAPPGSGQDTGQAKSALTPERWNRRGIPELPSKTDRDNIDWFKTYDRDHIDWFKTYVFDKGAYHARMSLRTTPRRVVDLALELLSILSKIKPDACAKTTTDADTDTKKPDADDRHEILEVLGRDFADRIAEDSGLTPGVRQKLLKDLNRSREQNWAIEWEEYLIEPQPGSQERALKFENVGVSMSKSESTSYFIYARTARGWVVRVKGYSGSESPTRTPFQFLFAPPRQTPLRLETGTASLFMLFQDLVNLVNLAPESTSPTPLMKNNPDDKCWAVTEWVSGSGGRVKLAWPTPPWRTFWEYDLFLGIWNKYLDKITVTNETPNYAALEQLVFGWLDSATAVLAWKSPVGIPGSLPLDWQNLVNQLEDMIEVTNENENGYRAQLAREWLTRVACLVMPEMIGEGTKISNHLAVSGKLKDYWKMTANSIWQSRERSLKQLEQDVMGAIGKVLRPRVPDSFRRFLMPKPPKKTPGAGEPNTTD